MIFLSSKGFISLRKKMSCPQCGGKLYRYMVQMKHAVVMCSNEQCAYPFSEPRGVEGNLVYVEGADVLDAAHRIAAKEQEKEESPKGEK